MNPDATPSPPRPWYRPQFRLRTMFVIMAYAAVALAINFWPPTIEIETRRPSPKELDKYGTTADYKYIATCGWPFKHLYVITRKTCKLEVYTGRYLEPEPVLDARGWPIDEPLPRVTDWRKLGANLLVFAVLGILLRWLGQWFVGMAHGVRRWLANDLPHSNANVTPIGLLCLLGLAAIAWGLVVILWQSLVFCDQFMNFGYDVRIADGKILHQLILPLLFIVGGMISLNAARYWLRAGRLNASCTWLAMGILFASVVIEVIALLPG